MEVGTLIILLSPDLKGISIGSIDFDNPKVYGDTFISDGLVYNCQKSTMVRVFFWYITIDNINIIITTTTTIIIIVTIIIAIKVWGGRI